MAWRMWWRKALAILLSTGLSLGTQPCIAQSAADGPCSSLRAGVKQLAARTAGTEFSGSYTVFDALLDELGFTEEFVLSLNARAVLIPSDEAFAKFFQKFTEAEVAPLQYVKLNSDVFKQIILFHFSVSELPGISGTADTALSALPQLHDEGFINVDAICGRQNSREVRLEYSRDGDSVTFSESVGQIFNTQAVATICNNPPQAVLYSLSTVLHPCPASDLFPYPLQGCQALSEFIPENPFRRLAARRTGSIVDNFNNPNLLIQRAVRSGLSGYTLFVPTQAALERAGVTNPAFVAVEGAFDHVLNGHTVRGKECLGGGDAELGMSRALRTLLSDGFCTPLDTITLSQGGPAPTETVVRTPMGMVANTTSRTNLRVCGGIVHEIDDVLLPCSMEEYMSQQQQQRQDSQTVVAPPASSAAARVGAAATCAAAAAVALL